jgi:hypothetical protein
MVQGTIWRASALVAPALFMPALSVLTANTAFAAEIGAKAGVSEEFERKVYEGIMPAFSDDGTFNPNALDTRTKSFVKLGTLPTEPDLTNIIAEKYLPGAAQ